MFRYSWSDSSVRSSSTERLRWTTRGANPDGGEPSAAARSPFASTSTARTRLPALTARSANEAVIVLRPVPPFPATQMTRRRSSVSRSIRSPAIACLTAVDGLQDVGGVSAGLDFPPLALDGAVGADQERGPGDTHVGAAPEFLLDPQALRVDEVPVGVADQRNRQPALLDEALVLLRGVRRDPIHSDASVGERRLQPGELLALNRAAGGVVLWIEIEDGAAPLQVVVGHPAATRRLEIEIG